MKRRTMPAAILVVLLALAGGELFFRENHHLSPNRQEKVAIITLPKTDTVWNGPDTFSFPTGRRGDLIRYGRDLIARTAWYFGPSGSISRTQNGMNCQNCHLKAGTQPWGNNFGGVMSTYPKFRERRGAMESMQQRISDCFQRSLNGEAPDSSSRAMGGMIAYMQWLGKAVPKGTKPAGSGIAALPFLQRAADPMKGRGLYEMKCQRCHGATGEGMPDKDGKNYTYPPLWGAHSYNTGAGLYRLSRLAGFIRNNMPLGVDYRKAELTNEEAWDLAAFINSQPRPVKQFRQDWPNISLKPVDHPFGPYKDSFPSRQHKFGPFGPILQARKAGR